MNFKEVIVSFVAAATMSVTAFAQEPVIEKLKGNVFSDVRKVDVENPVGNVKGNALRIDGDRLYYSHGNTLNVYDIANPLEPVKLGSCKIKGLGRQVTSKDGYVFIAARETGLWVVDARDPGAPKVIKRYDAIELATGVDVAGNLLLIAMRQNGVEFVDITDPADPQHIYLQKTPESQSVWYDNGIVYSGEWQKSEVTVIDAHDLSDIKVINRIPLKGYGDGVYTYGKYLFAATGHNGNDKSKTKEENVGAGHALQVFDITDPENAVEFSRTAFGNCYKRGYNDFWTPRPNGDGKICFVADTFNGAYAVDVKNPSRPKIVGRITFEGSKGGTPVSSIAVGNGAVYLASYTSGLYVASCPKAKAQKIEKGKLPENVAYRYPYQTPEDSHFTEWKPSKRALVRGAATCGDVIYAACSDAGLAILKQGADGNLKEIGRGASKFAGDVKVMDERLFVAEGLDGLAVYQIKGETELEEICRWHNLGYGIDWCLWVWTLSDEYLGVSGRYSGNIILDIREFPKYKPVFHVGSFAGWDKYFAEKISADKQLIALIPNKGVKWIDLSSDGPREVCYDTKNAPTLMSGVSHYKNGNGIVCIKRQLRILEAGRKYEEPAPGVTGDFEGAPLWDGGNLLSLNTRIKRQIRLVDVTDDSAPKLLFKENTEGNPEIPTFFKGKLLVPCGYQGLLLQK